jgi:aminoglycoside phosphotransferase (APT) family kinase protein
VFYSCLGLIKNAADEVETWPESAQFAGKIRQFTKDMMGHMNRATLRNDSAFNVLNHGDAWVNNMLFRYSNTGQPESVLFVDYQLCHYTSPALDLQNFIHTSPKDEVRLRHMDTLLQVSPPHSIQQQDDHFKMQPRFNVK